MFNLLYFDTCFFFLFSIHNHEWAYPEPHTADSNVFHLLFPHPPPWNMHCPHQPDSQTGQVICSGFFQQCAHHCCCWCSKCLKVKRSTQEKHIPTHPTTHPLSTGDIGTRGKPLRHWARLKLCGFEGRIFHYVLTHPRRVGSKFSDRFSWNTVWLNHFWFAFKLNWI